MFKYFLITRLYYNGLGIVHYIKKINYDKLQNMCKGTCEDELSEKHVQLTYNKFLKKLTTLIHDKSIQE